MLTFDQKKYFERQIQSGYQEDLVLIDHVSEEEVEKILHARLLRMDMYTSIGPVLIAVNPYRILEKGGISIYNEEVAYHYQRLFAYEVAPHIFAIAASAFRNINDTRKNQCVIVSLQFQFDAILFFLRLLENLARGIVLEQLLISVLLIYLSRKTEAAKHLMKYLITVCSGQGIAFQKKQIYREPTLRQNNAVPVKDVTVEKIRLAELNDYGTPTERAVIVFNELCGRDSMAAKMKSRMRRRESIQLPTSRPVALAAGGEVSSQVERELKEAFDELASVNSQGMSVVSLEDLLQIGQVAGMLEDGRVSEAFVGEVARRVLRGGEGLGGGDTDSDQPACFPFPQFQVMIRAIEVEAKHAEQSFSRARRSSAVFDYFAMSVGVDEEVQLASASAGVNPLQVGTVLHCTSLCCTAARDSRAV